MIQNVLAGANVPAHVAIGQQSFPPELPGRENPHQDRDQEQVGKGGGQQTNPAAFQKLIHARNAGLGDADRGRSHHPTYSPNSGKVFIAGLSFGAGHGLGVLGP